MTIKTYPVLALLVLATACARPAAEPDAAADTQGSQASEPPSVAQATAGKPLIHVWKSPT